jgi:hypothetical protein
VFVRGYRFRLPAFSVEQASSGAISEGFASLRPPYERAVRLAKHDDPAEILELHWFRDEETYRAKLGVPTAQIHGLRLEEPFPGLLVPPDTQIEELEFESDVPMGYAWHLPRIPPSQFPRDYEALRRLAAGVVEGLRPILPPAFSLAFDYGRLLVLREHEVLQSTDMGWALDGDDEVLEGCMRHVLDDLQAVLAEETTEPWPNTRPKLPWPDVRVRDGALVMRFADDEGLVVELEPIDLQEIRG